MNITEIMSSPIKSVTLDDFLKDVKEIFDSNDIRHLIVIEEGTLIGIVSERDLLKNISPYLNSNVYTTRDLATLNQRVIHIVTRNPKFLKVTDQVEDAIALFNSVRIGCIPIVDEDHVPVGIVTRGDVIRHFYKIKVQMSIAPQESHQQSVSISDGA
jgi:acetoin utilization protein AcuB